MYQAVTCHFYWRIFGVLVDVDYSTRFKPKNIIIFGIFLGKNSNIQKLLEMIFDPTINNGLCIINGYEICIKYLIADKPARSKILNMQGHNAKYPCCFCTMESRNEIVNSKLFVYNSTFLIFDLTLIFLQKYNFWEEDLVQIFSP